jgi:DNA-binding ferritin-like protein
MTDDVAERIRRLEAQAETAYERMYGAHDKTSAMACYNDAKESFTDAIALARQSDDEATAARLDARRAHVKAVYRSQFS